MALVAVLFGLFTTIAWGVGDFVGAKASKRVGGYTAAFLILSVAGLTYALIYLLFLRSHTVFDGVAIAYSLASGVTFTLANLAFYKGLEHGPVSIVSPLSSLYPLVTTLMLVVIFHSQLSMRQGVGIVVVVAGAMIASDLLQRNTLKRGLSRGPALALVAAFFFGIAFGLITQAINRIGWQFPTLIELVGGILLYLVLLPVLERRRDVFSPKRLVSAVRLPVVWIAGLLIEAGFLATTKGIDYAPDLAPAVVALSACYPVLTAILALKHLRESFQLMPLLGAFTAIGGIVILSLG